MNAVDFAFFLIEIVGTVAFAVSGAMIAIDRNLDLFGVLFLGATTAIGGGIMRDILLGHIPPRAFSNYLYLTVAVVTALAVFLCTAWNRKDGGHRHRFSDAALNFFDAAGLGIFSVVGVQNTISAGFGDNGFFCIFLGMITGIGGGMLRDMMSRATPMVLHKQVYALASLGGSICYYFLRHFSHTWAVIIATGLVMAVRLLAAHYRWKLPKVRQVPADKL